MGVRVNGGMGGKGEGGPGGGSGPRAEAKGHNEWLSHAALSI